MQGFVKGFLLVTIFTVVVGDAHWTYKEEKLWPGKCQDGKHQSPVNLRKDYSERRHFNDFQFNNYDSKYEASIVNTGHSVAIKITDPGDIPSIRGGGLPYEYVLDHLHFHWESEHTIHSNRYPLELHFVHYANIYNSTAVAAQHDDGLAVLGVLFDISEDDNPAFEPILEHLDEVRNVQNMAVSLSSDIAPVAFLPKDMENFFRYEGSLTTPGCNEAVIWTVFYHTSFISKRQMEMFPSIQTDEGILKANYRSLQQLNDRVVVFRGNIYSNSVSHGKRLRKSPPLPLAGLAHFLSTLHNLPPIKFAYHKRYYHAHHISYEYRK